MRAVHCHAASAMLALLACDTRTRSASVPTPAPVVTMASDAGSDARAANSPAPAAVSVMVDGGVASNPPLPPAPPLSPPPQHGWLDLPAWPAGDRLELTWLVTRVHDSQDDESSKRPLTLVMTIGNVSRSLVLPRQLGALNPRNQPMCKTSGYPLGKRDVARITFYEGGAGGLLVRRSAPDVLELLEWFQSDGACPDANGDPVVCPPREKRVLRLHVPAFVPVHEKIVELDGGVRKLLDCAAD